MLSRHRGIQNTSAYLEVC